MLSSKKGQVGSPAKLLNSFGAHAVPLIHLLQYLCLVDLKDGHSVESRTCLSRCHVGLTEQSRVGSTRLGRKERAGLPRGGRSWREVHSEPWTWSRDCGVSPLHRTNEVGEVSGRCISEAGGERPLPRPGNLMKHVREKRQLSHCRAQTRAKEETLVELRWLGLTI